MASAKKEAQSKLGREDDYINLAGLNREREIANQVYNTNRTTFQNAYDDLLSTIASNRQKARTNFSSGRSTISENAYMQNRQTAEDLASRGLSGGLAQLSKLGNRMETGRQYSNLANTFYNTMNELDATQRTGENEYNTNLEMAQNDLNIKLADIGAREAAARNNYRAQVAQLAEQIQARRDAAAAAAASLALQRQQYRQAGIDAKNAEMKLLNSDLLKIAGTNPTEKSYKAAMAEYRARMGGNDRDAMNYLTKLGIGRGITGPYGPQTPWKTGGTAKSNSSILSSLYKDIYAKSTAGGANALSNYLYNTLGKSFSSLLRR